MARVSAASPPAWEYLTSITANYKLSKITRKIKDVYQNVSHVAVRVTEEEKTKRHFKVQICEHLGIYISLKVKIDNNKLTAIQEHLLCCNYCPSFEDFSILTRESNDFKLRIMESLLIARDKPILNKGDSSLPLELF